MVVVDAVDDEVHPAADRVVGLPVEEHAVQPVLGQRPDHEAGDDQQRRSERALAVVGAEPDARDDHGHEDDRGHRGVDPREEVEEPVLEEAAARRSVGLFALVPPSPPILAFRKPR